MLAATLCVIVLNLSTVFFAAFIGPLLDFVFSANFARILREPSGGLRAIWQFFPDNAIEQVEALDPSQALWIPPLIVLAVAVIRGVAYTGQFFLFGRAGQRVLRALRQDAFAALLSHPPAFYAQRSHGDLLSRLTGDTNHIEQAVFYGYGSLLRDTLAVLGLIAYVFYADWRLALIALLIVPLAIIPLIGFARWLKKVSTRSQVAQGEVNTASYEALAGIRVVQAFIGEEYEQQRFARASERYYRQTLLGYFIRAVRTPTMDIMGAFALAAMIAFLGYHARTGGADPAHYVSFLGAIFLMYDPLTKLGRVAEYMAAGSAAADRVFEIIDLEPSIKDVPAARTLPRFGEQVVFDNVTFTYAPDGDAVLSGLSMTLPAGHCVALVGRSGSGKTTLVNLLPRFYDVRQGSIAIDGMDIRNISLRSLRRQISVVSQDTFLFNASVADNIAYGFVDAGREAIVQAAKLAHAHDFIAHLPQGYDTIIGERGVLLSGGQRQRIAIARALLRDTPLLILDEATSNLDIESERHIQAALDTLMKGRTSLVIAHRLTTVRRADQICVLKGGEIVERGSHEELMRLSGEYARLYTMQFHDEAPCHTIPGATSVHG